MPKPLCLNKIADLPTHALKITNQNVTLKHSPSSKSKIMMLSFRFSNETKMFLVLTKPS